jgi:hypothetical protein
MRAWAGDSVQEAGSMYRLLESWKAIVWAGAFLFCAIPAQGAIIDVCATCTYTDLDSAFAAATSGDTIVLDGPASMPATTYTLAAGLTVDASKDDITIRGKSQGSRPDYIEIEYAAGPVITVDSNVEFRIEGVTVKGGTTGILAMADSEITIERCLIDAISGIGVDCVDVSRVTMRSTIVANCTGAATKIDMGGFLDIIQCTFVNNGSFGVEAPGGKARIEATLIHDSDDGAEGLSGDATTLEVDGLWVTLLDSTNVGTPVGVTDANPIAVALDPTVVFAASTFPGEIALGQIQRTGAAAQILSSPNRDFSNLSRNRGDLAAGADEQTAFGGGGAQWTECFVVQNGQQRRYVGEGTISIEVTTPNIDLNANNAAIFIKHNLTPDISAVGAPVMGPFTLETSTLDTSFGFVDVPIIEDDFTTTFAPFAVQNEDFIIYIHTLAGPLSDTANLLGDTEGATAETLQAVTGRVFGLDTIPPTVATNFNLLADQYLTAAADGGVIDAGGPWGVGAGALLGNVGANAGHLDGTAGDPQVFFDEPNAGLTLNFGISLSFTDVGSGFATTGLPTGDVHSSFVDKFNALHVIYADTPGMAWWDVNAESERELLTSATQLTVTYTNVGGNQLDTDWQFTGNLHDLANQWHAIANIRVTDLAGNEATLDPSMETYIPMKPFHMWWFPDIFARIKSGPSGGETTDPRFTWGLERLGGGKDPADPYPCPPGARWRVWRAASPGLDVTTWLDITSALSADGWSDWMDPVLDGAIGLDTFFNFSTGDTLGDILNAAGVPGDEFLLTLVGYDEAGNLQPVPGFVNPTAADFDAAGVAYNRWTSPGTNASVGLDTQVRPFFWHNRTDGVGNPRDVDGGERVFGAVSRVPLPPIDEVCQRVEGRFTVSMGISNMAAAAPRFVWFELYEDGRRVLGAQKAVAAGVTETDIVIPDDIVVSPVAYLFDSPATRTNFLNFAQIDSFTNQPYDCDGDSFPDRDRLGDDGDVDAEPSFRRRQVKYVLRVSTMVDLGGTLVLDETPASVEFTVTAGSGGSKTTEQSIKQFKRE